MKFVRVNMGTRQASLEEAPKEYELIGNRGLIGKILMKEIPVLRNNSIPSFPRN
jgi:hypothetical protein